MSAKPKHIEECVRDNLEAYFKDLRGVEPAAMYEMILGVVEKPLLDVVMKQADGNQSKAACLAPGAKSCGDESPPEDGSNFVRNDEDSTDSP